MMTVPCFLIAKKVNVRNERLRQALANLTVCGFGVYMIHYFFTGPCVLLARMCHIPVAVQIPVAALIAFGASWGLVNLLRRLTGSILNIWWDKIITLWQKDFISSRCQSGLH